MLQRVWVGWPHSYWVTYATLPEKKNLYSNSTATNAWIIQKDILFFSLTETD